ncbi:hypothetical protein GCM10022414_19060 [Zhongshania borealis]|uniref:Uncharacterized protein n=1 Tax=Zhongshania borealis TaxID=889488 RepID=A0ABP7WRJ0_9GAMM
MGIASNACDTTSGGVRIIPIAKQEIIMYGRFSLNAFLLDIPLAISSTVAIGISKARPKARNNLSAVFRYREISGV